MARGVPFLATVYVLPGRGHANFGDGAEKFVGRFHPEEDIREYLFEMYAVERRNPISESESALMELRAALKRSGTKRTRGAALRRERRIWIPPRGLGSLRIMWKQLINQKGRSKELAPVDLTAEPEVTALVKAVDLEDLAAEA